MIDYLSEHASPGVATAGKIIVGLYIVVALTSWFINPLANIFLFFHKDGKYALTNSEKWGALFTTTALVTGLSLMIVHFATQTTDESMYSMAGVLALTLALPLSILEFPLRLRNTTIGQYYAMGLLLTGLVFLGLTFAGLMTLNLFWIYLIAVIAFTWIAPFAR